MLTLYLAAVLSAENTFGEFFVPQFSPAGIHDAGHRESMSLLLAGVFGMQCR
jgi:hypothetical protein